MKKIYFITALIVFSVSLNAQVVPQYTQILKRFEEWKAAQYIAGKYCTPANCKTEVVTKDGYKGPSTGIPKDISLFYTDINGDNKLDALIVFSPLQCDGGNALMNARENLLILSKNNTYVVDDTYFDKIEATLKSGWIHIDGAFNGSFSGTFYDYKEDDPRCCPSVRKEFSIDHKTKKLEFQ